MKIDQAAEDLGRHAVRWAIASDREKFMDSLVRISEAPPEVRDQVLPIYVAVGAVAIRAIYQGSAPNQPQNEATARAILEAHPWAPLELADLYEILESYSAEDREPSIAPEKLPVAVFLADAHLLTWNNQGLGYKDFYGFLDDILNGLASAKS